jgi:putative lipoic acid-binding regulatory protein
MTDAVVPTDGAAAPRPELLQFPTDFPVKIMGLKAEGFIEAVTQVVLRHAPDFDASTLALRPSRQGTYLGLTATIRATSRAQLDALYLELTAHPMVKVVL